jgi:hypothetical protein
MDNAIFYMGKDVERVYKKILLNVKTRLTALDLWSKGGYSICFIHY